MDIKRVKICMVPNGIGKTTLMRILGSWNGEGYVKHGHNVRFRYCDQGQLLNENNTVIGELQET